MMGFARSALRSLVYLILCAGFLTSTPAAESPLARSIAEANKALGRGINIGNYLEAPRGQSWGFTLKPQQLKAIKDAGFDSIRLPVRWNDYALEQAPYTIEPDFFQRIDTILDQAESLRLNVVLNIHHYEQLDKDPAGHSERFKALWKQIAPRYQSRGSFLFFELNNEPHDKLDAATWNRLFTETLDIVRTSNPVRPVIVGPTFWNNLSALPSLQLPPDTHLIVTVHYYNPFEFTHQGATWTDAKVRDIRDRPWGMTDADANAVRHDFDKIVAWARENQRPIFVGEFGSYEKAPMESRVRWTQTIARECEARGFSWAYWEFGSGFGAYDPSKDAWRPELLRALLPRP